jgi:formylglycine-generating enzyme required for sulfatase activity
VDYGQWLSQQTGKHFRLPTEAEWEYAARAGSTSSRFWSDDPAQACHYANVFDKLHQEKIRSTYNVPLGLATHHDCEDPYLTLAPVGSFQPNAWGLFDMLGNVWEWVADCPHQNYSDAPNLAHQAWDIENQGVCTKRVVRGGSWFVGVRDVRVVTRNSDRIEDRGTGLGFRLVMDD